MTTISSYSTYKGTEVKKRTSLRIHKQWRTERLMIQIYCGSIVFCIIVYWLDDYEELRDSEQSAVAGTGERVIIVSSGDTLWNIASDIRETGQDIRRVVYDLKSRNNLSSSVLQAGQSLIIPAD